jgi:hypothetical protein
MKEVYKPFKNAVPILSYKILPDGTKEYIPNNCMEIAKHYADNPEMTYDDRLAYYKKNYKEG